MQEIKFKICNKCNLEKHISNFSIRKNKIKNGIKLKYRNNCKACMVLKSKNYKINNENKVKNYQEEYRNNHKKELKKYRDENKVIKVKNNPKEVRNKRSKKRYKEDPNFKLRKNISNIINIALKENNSSKNGDSCLKYLSENYINNLKLHLENLFEPWMNWNNHGKYNKKTYDINPTWQLDHIIPQSDLFYTSMEDNNFKICWELKNIRPYSSKQNILDGAKRIRHKNNFKIMHNNI